MEKEECEQAAPETRKHRLAGALVGFKVKTPTKIAKEWRLFGMNSSPLTPWAAASGIPYTACWEKVLGTQQDAWLGSKYATYVAQTV